MASGRAKKDPWVRWFDVTDPVKHKSGYTIYKVTSKVFPVHSPEATTEIVVWKRYRDFWKLHSYLANLHSNLHRPGTFPDFPKPQIFGRFDDVIIEQRRLSALKLLNFVGSQAHLFNTLAVQQFFATSESFDGEKPCREEAILEPERAAPLRDLIDTSLPIRAETSQLVLGDTSQLISSDTSPGCADISHSTGILGSPGLNQLEPRSLETNSAHASYLCRSDSGPKSGLDTIWAHRQDSVDSSVDSAEVPLTSEGQCVNSVALALSELPDLEGSANSNFSQGHLPVGADITPFDADAVEQFDPLWSGSRAETNRVDVSNTLLLADLKEGIYSLTSDGVTNTVDSLEVLSPNMELAQADEPEPVPPSDSLDGYIKDRDDYLYRAVKQVRRAKQALREQTYQVAFDCYKKAVAILLQGVQVDSDESRRNIVRRKTAEYLVYAEALYKCHLDSQGETSQWQQGPSVPRNVARLRGGLTELSQFKVLGLVGGNMLVIEKTTEQTFIIKVLQKNACGSSSSHRLVSPTKCRHMVKLHRYFETESSVYLLLEYAKGGTLWQYVYSYLHSGSKEPNPGILHAGDIANVYSGHKSAAKDNLTQTIISDRSIKPLSGQVFLNKGDDSKQYSLSQVTISTASDSVQSLPDQESIGRRDDSVQSLPDQKCIGQRDDTVQSLPDQESVHQRDAAVQSLPDHESVDRRHDAAQCLPDQESVHQRDAAVQSLPDHEPVDRRDDAVQSLPDQESLAGRDDHSTFDGCSSLLSLTTDFQSEKEGDSCLVLPTPFGIHDETNSHKPGVTLACLDELVRQGSHTVNDEQTMDAATLAAERLLSVEDDIFSLNLIVGSPGSGTIRERSLRRTSSSGARSVSAERSHDLPSPSQRKLSDVFDLIDRSVQNRVLIPENYVRRWGAELLTAMLDLHEQGLILKRLCAENILLDERGHIQLTYFCQWPGVLLDIPVDKLNRFCLAPEASLPGGLCPASDFWSLGVILYELLTGLPLHTVHAEGIHSHSILKMPESLSAEAQHLLKHLLHHNPSERLGGGQSGVDELKNHPFFATIDWSTV